MRVFLVFAKPKSLRNPVSFTSEKSSRQGVVEFGKTPPHPASGHLLPAHETSAKELDGRREVRFWAGDMGEVAGRAQFSEAARGTYCHG